MAEVAIEVLNNGATALDFRNKLNSNFAALKSAVDSVINSIVIYVYDINDFPPPVSGVIQLENKHYYLQAPILMPYQLKEPLTGSVKFSSDTSDNALVNVSGLSLFTNDQTQATTSILSLEHIVLAGVDIGAGRGSVYDLSITSQDSAIYILGSFVAIDGFESLGTIENITYFTYNNTIQNCKEGLVLIDPFQVETSLVTIYGGEDETTNFFDISGTNISAIGFSHPVGILTPNERYLNIDPEVEQGDTRITINNGSINNESAFLRAGSSDHTYINASFSSNVGFSNSASKAQMLFFGNALVTTNPGTGVPARVNAIWSNGNSERFVFQDICTFDNTTNTLTFANHGLTNGDIINNLHTYTGTLPSELDSTTKYYVISATTNTFQISLTSGGAAVEFTDDGTGTNYFRHHTGNSLGWMIYIGNEIISIEIFGDFSAKNSDATDVKFRSYIYKSDLAGNITQLVKGITGSAIDTKNGNSPVKYQTDSTIQGEGFLFYVSQDDNPSDDLTVVDSVVTFKKL